MTSKIDIIQGNVFDKIKDLKDNSIDCVVSSPPYFGLRDYGTAQWQGGNPNCSHSYGRNTRGGLTDFQKNNKGSFGDEAIKTNEHCKLCGAKRIDEQFGLEKTYQEYINKTVELFNLMKPKLKDTATIWWNVGDSYSSGQRKTITSQSVKKPKSNEILNSKQKHLEGLIVRPPVQQGIKEKDLIMIPNRVAIALQDAGWYIRSEIIWHKPNPMPESIKDRPTSCHEKIWLITKSKKYYYDSDAIREPLKTEQNKSLNKTNGKYLSDDNEKKHRQGMSKSRGTNLVITRPKLPDQKNFVKFLREKTTLKDLVENTDIKKTTIEHWFRNDELGFAFPSVEDWNKIKDYINDWSNEFNDFDYRLTYTETHLDEIKNNPLGRNKRNVWTVTTKPCKEAHFATFPIDLIEPCILAGCPEKVCVKCGKPQVKEFYRDKSTLPVKRNKRDGDGDRAIGGVYQKWLQENPPKITLKASCDCNADFKSGVVLDPFGGSGTTGIAAKKHNRNSILIELNKEYIEIMNKRINNFFGLFKD